MTNSSEITEIYLTTINKIRATLDEVEDTFLKYPEVDINLYKTFEKQVIEVTIIYIDKFVQAYENHDFEEMSKTHDELIEAVIVISQKFTG